MKFKRIGAALAAAGVLTVGGAAAAHFYPLRAAESTVVAEAQHPAPSAVPVVALPNFAALVQKYGPAVVNIDVSGTKKVGYNLGQNGDDEGSGNGNDPFFQFFRGLPFQFHFGVPQEVPMRGEGSGFIVSSDGVILTNAHVVRDADEVTVNLTDRREFKAKVIGVDPATDIAVLRIDAKNLPVVKLGDPSTAHVGDWVIAIGSPFGFQNSVTAGIVSAKGRSLPGDVYVPFIQTDVAVNPGNSGGPLFDLAGEVIGINSQIYSRSGGYEGLSFAIPIDVATRVEHQILATGHATHARLGVTIQEVNRGLADSFGMKKAEGALVSQVVPGSAAAAAGLKAGDVITKFDGHPIVSSTDLPELVGKASPGDKATLEVWRKDGTRQVAVTLGKAEEESVASAGEGQKGAEKARLGLAVRALTPQERQQADVPNGLLVEGVAGTAARAGVQPGDILLSVNGTEVKSVAQLRHLIDHASKNVALLVQRGDSRIFVPVRIG
ncbi:MAG TPA: DegQ family serine endoprotease [Burkholderiales bacterium]|nr:DegQ family serine endoprotease [Burkholderiales bacterium]